jgi:hypothetical protein
LSVNSLQEVPDVIYKCIQEEAMTTFRK